MAKNKTKKNKPVQHITYNKKSFLAPESIRSMSVIHTKIKECGEASVVISDCRNSIKLWNNTNNKEESVEMVEKISVLIDSLTNFRHELLSRNENIQLLSVKIHELPE